MYKNKICIVLIFLILAFSACTSALHPLETEPVKPGLNSKAHPSLKKMPAPKSKVTAAVYRFRDQTGQYKPSERGANWSTAVTQGATSILIKSMEDSGWFTPIEREGVSNLLNERQIIQKTRKRNGQNSQLPPLLFAGILLEGGVIGYDTNVITGGGGARFLGMDLSGQYRKDQVTIYLRAVSTKTGKILKTVHTTKSIISQELKTGAFRYVDVNQILEAEAGFTYNEPPVMAVTEAIDEAVKMIVIEGEQDNLWTAQDTTDFNSYKQKYKQKKKWEQRAQVNYFGLTDNKNFRSGLNISANVLYGSYIGSYNGAESNAGFSLNVEYFLNPSFSVSVDGQRSSLGVSNKFSNSYLGFGVGFKKYFTGRSKLSPYVGLGGGGISYEHNPSFTNNYIFPSVDAEAGFDYRFSESMGMKLGFSYRYLMQDGVDGITKGTIHDQIWNISAGVTVAPSFINK